MKLQKNNFVWWYGVLVLFDIICGYASLSHLRLVSKPLILSSLIIYFVVQAKSNRNASFYLMLAALLFSLFGDVFLLFETSSGIYFTLGLGSFLLAHLLFSLNFIKRWNNNLDSCFKVFVLVLFSYGIVLFFFLKENLGSLQIPVILYILGILAMVLTAFKRKGKVPKSSFNFVFIGSLFFVLSDTVLAIDKFFMALPMSHIIIMGTYATAQYLITKGILIQGDFNN